MRKQYSFLSLLFFALILAFSFPLDASPLTNPGEAPSPEQEAVEQGLQFEFQTGLAKFSFDGHFDNGDFGFGFQYQTPKAVIEPGAYLTTNIDLNNASSEEVFFVGVLAQIQFQRTISIGIYYDWWKTGSGLVKWDKENTGFTLSYNFEF